MKTKRSTSVLLVAVLAVLAMLAAACGDDDGDSTETGASTTDTTEPDTTDTTDATDEGAGEDEGEGEETTTTTTEPEEEIVLTDSFRGVTAESIKIGVPFVDTTALGWSPTHDADVIWQVAADTINAEGGVLGRTVDLVTLPIDPTDSVGQDAVCVQLTEDEAVFAVMGVLLREAPICYTAQHDTIAINTFETAQDIYDRSTAPLIGFPPLPERALETQVAAILESGVLDGSKVALSAAGPDSTELADNMKGLLEAGGVEVVSQTNFLSDNSDQAAIDAEMDINVEVWRADGADAVVVVPGASVPTTGALSRNGWDGAYVITDAPGTDLGLLGGFGYGTEALVGSVAFVPPDEADLYEADQAGVKECVDTFDAAFDDDAEVEIRPEDSQTAVIGVVVRACQALELFTLVAEAAGPELTNDSFATAADGMGEFTVTGVLDGSLGPGKRDYIDTGAALFEFDETLQRFVLA